MKHEDGSHKDVLTVDRDTHEVNVDGVNKYLPPKEFGLLVALMEANGQMRSREHLLQSVWGHDEGANIDTRTVDQHLTRLRRKLGRHRNVVITMSNFGYRIAPGTVLFKGVKITIRLRPRTLSEAIVRLGQSCGLRGHDLEEFAAMGTKMIEPFANGKTRP